jgi:hypothetical protein
MFGLKKKVLPITHEDVFEELTRVGDLVTFVNAGEAKAGLAFGRVSEMTKHHVVVDQIFPYEGYDRVPVMRSQKMFALFTTGDEVDVDVAATAEMDELRSVFVQKTEEPVTDLLNVEAKVGDLVVFKQRRKSALSFGTVTSFKGKNAVVTVVSEKGRGKSVKCADSKFMVYRAPAK